MIGCSSGLRIRWPVFYLGIALIELLVVALVIQLYRGVALEYRASVAQSATWAGRVAQLGRLEVLGNDVLSSTRAKLAPGPNLESGRREAGLGEFAKQLERVREELGRAPSTPQVTALSKDLESVSSLMNGYGADAWVVVSYVRDGLTEQAARENQALNQTAASVRGVLRRMASTARGEQEKLLFQQERTATSAQGAAWTLVAAVVLLLGLIVLHTIQLFRRARRFAAAADAGVRSRSAFLTRMGYAIRTPMNSIIGMTEVVLDTPLTSEQKSSLETVRSSAEELLWTLTNVLDYAKAQAGRLSLEKASFDVRVCIHDVVRTMASRARAKGIEIVWSVDAEVPHSVRGDAKRLQRVIGNLVDNAITYTDFGEVVVHARTDARRDDEIVLSFDVSDTGTGIPDEKRRRLFDAFHEQAREAGSAEGIGLGLATSAELVAQMGGEIDVESEVGRGTTFRFTAFLEADADAANRAPIESGSDLRGLRVLVVDDNASSRQILCGMLRGAGAVPAPAESADEAIAMLRAANEAGRPYAVALVDLEMPQVGGLEFAQQIRADSVLSTTTLVALGATGENDEGQQCREIGMAGYLPKPIRASELIDVMHGVVAATGVPQRGRDANGGFGRLRVLLADDNRVDRRLGARLLEKRGHDVVAVENGNEAIEVSGREPFDLILMDVQMPQLDGLEATLAIRERERRTGRHVPIIALTAHDMKGRCAEVGMDDYVTKPVDAYEVNEVITRHIPTREVDMEDSQSNSAGPRPMDEEAALERAGGEHALLVELANMCLADTPDALDSIRSAVHERDGKAIQRAAHKLKGSLLVLAADPASEAAYRLETLGAEDTLDNVAKALEALEQELARLQPALTKLARSEELGVE